MTFWQSKSRGGWIVNYFPKLQNILELIPDLCSYLLTAHSFKLFWYVLHICLKCNLSGLFSPLEPRGPEVRTKNSSSAKGKILEQAQEKELNRKTG